MSELGAHFRTLYVDKLKFLDEKVSNNIYIQAIYREQQLVIGGVLFV